MSEAQKEDQEERGKAGGEGERDGRHVQVMHGGSATVTVSTSRGVDNQ